MEVITAAAAGWAVMCPGPSRIQGASATAVKEPFNQTLRTQRQFSILQIGQPAVALRRRSEYGLRALPRAGEYATKEDGHLETQKYREFFPDKTGKTISASHDNPLKAGDGLYNFILEIPKESSAKMEVATDDPNMPVRKDTKKGKLPFYSSGSESPSLQRRAVMGKAAALLMSMISLPVVAAEADFTLYQDDEDKYSLLVPPEWLKGEGNSGTRKVTAFFPESDSSANVNIIITGLGADYTGLGSFGTVDIFAENLVNSLDRAWQRPKGQAAKLVDARSKNGMYYVEYTIQKPGEAKRHLLSVVGIASNGWIKRLYTVTGQYWEDDGDKYKTNLEKAISSFRFI